VIQINKFPQINKSFHKFTNNLDGLEVQEGVEGKDGIEGKKVTPSCRLRLIGLLCPTCKFVKRFVDLLGNKIL
jgi:hypothetical protein